MHNISSEDIITREQLYELVWKEPIAVFSRKNALSEYALRKACKVMKIPTPKAGYWENVRLGKKIHRQELTKDPSAVSYIGMSSITKTKAKTNTLTNSVWIRHNPAPTSPGALDPLVLAAQLRLTATHKIVTNKYNGLLACSKDELDIRVSETLVQRAIRWMNCFIETVKTRKHSISVYNGSTYVIIYGQAIKIYMREITKSAAPKNKWINTPLIPTGILAFKMEGYWGKEWRDGTTRLEVQLINIIEELETRARELNEETLNSETEKLAALEIEKASLLKKNLVEKELDEFKKLLQTAEQWQKAQTLKAYIAEWKYNTITKGELTPEIAEKIEWATKKADWYDPFTNAQDALFLNIDKTTLQIKSGQNIS